LARHADDQCRGDATELQPLAKIVSFITRSSKWLDAEFITMLVMTTFSVGSIVLPRR
jgi:hypothetical protein